MVSDYRTEIFQKVSICGIPCDFSDIRIDRSTVPEGRYQYEVADDDESQDDPSRVKVIYNQLKSDIRDILKQLCSYKGVEIIEGYLMPDHIHMLVSIPPKMSVSSFMGYLKGKSALMIFDRHANLKYKFGNRHFWSEGYYVSTVGLNEATIKKYIQDQEKYDIMQDKLSVKEYVLIPQ